MCVSKFSIEEMFRIQFQKKMKLEIEKHFEMKKHINQIVVVMTGSGFWSSSCICFNVWLLSISIYLIKSHDADDDVNVEHCCNVNVFDTSVAGLQ